MSDKKKTLTLGKNLTALCNKRGITLTTLARRCGVKQPTLHGWSTGRSVKKIEDLAVVCEFFDISLYEMLFGTPDLSEIEQQRIEEIFFDEIQITIKKIKKREDL